MREIQNARGLTQWCRFAYLSLALALRCHVPNAALVVVLVDKNEIVRGPIDIVREHGGKLKLDTEEGKYTRFTLCLPKST